MRSSAARAALRSTRLLLQLFRANYSWGMDAYGTNKAVARVDTGVTGLQNRVTTPIRTVRPGAGMKLCASGSR